MTLVQTESVNHAIELIADGACLELIDNIVEAKVVLATETTFEHILDMTERFEIEFSATGSWGGVRVGALLHDSGDEVFVSLLCLGVPSSVQSAGIVHQPADTKVHESAPDDSSFVDELVTGHGAGHSGGS